MADNNWTWSDEQRARWREKRDAQYEADREREENEREEYQQLMEAPSPSASERRKGRLAERRVYYQRDVGKFIMPEDAALITLLYYVRDPSYAIGFKTEDYPAFDQIIAQHFKSKRFSEPYHPRYGEYEPLRQNLAAVRNFIYCHAFPDGSFDKSDEAKVSMLEDMAHELGRALNHSRKALSFNSLINLNEANTPTLGAAALYKTLLDIQNKRSILHPIKLLMGWPNKNWNLPPIEMTPFGDLLRANTANSGNMVESNEPSAGEMMAEISHEMDMHVHNFNHVEDLQQPVVNESVDLAREILDKMKIQMGAGLDDPWKGQNPEKVLDQANAIAHLTNTFEQYTAYAAARNQYFRTDQAFFGDARETVGKLSGIIKKEATRMLSGEGKETAARSMADQVARMPNSWKTATPAALRVLLGKLETGIEQSYQVSQALQKAQASAIQQTNNVHHTHNAHKRRHTENAQQGAQIDQKALRAVAQALVSKTPRGTQEKSRPRERSKPELSSSDLQLIGKLSDATGQDPAAVKKELEKTLGKSTSSSERSR